MVILDTNIIIEHLRLSSLGKKSILRKLNEKYSKDELAISIISIQELYEGLSTKNEQKEQILLSILSPIKILPYSYEVAKLAGEIARDIKRPINLADATLASTTIINASSLATLNSKDFKGIPGLELLDLTNGI